MLSRSSTTRTPGGPTPKPATNTRPAKPSLATKPVIPSYPPVPSKKPPSASAGSNLRNITPTKAPETAHDPSPAINHGTASKTTGTTGTTKATTSVLKTTPTSTAAIKTPAPSPAPAVPKINPATVIKPGPSITHGAPYPHSTSGPTQPSTPPSTTPSKAHPTDQPKSIPDGIHAEPDKEKRVSIASKIGSITSAAGSLDKGLHDIMKGAPGGINLPHLPSLPGLSQATASNVGSDGNQDASQEPVGQAALPNNPASAGPTDWTMAEPDQPTDTGSTAPDKVKDIPLPSTASNEFAHVVLHQHEKEVDRSSFAELDPDAPVVSPPTVVPEAGDWIMFHAEHEHTVKVGWWKTYFLWEDAEYYRVPCYWSADEDFATHAPQPTLIFVAKEWMDLRYIVPAASELGFLNSHHVRTSRLFKNVGKSGAWVKAQLDHHFFYGQDKAEDPQDRWIVYHPPERNPFQGRFVKSLKQRVFENIASHVPSIADPFGLASGGFNATTPEKVCDVMLTIDGDLLHRFQLPDNPEYITNVRTAQTTLVQQMQTMLQEVGIDHAAVASDTEGTTNEEAQAVLHESQQTLIVALQGLKSLDA